MKNFGLTLNLQDDAAKIAEYRRAHQAVWPEVTDRLRVCGVQQMQIFLKGNRLFMYLVTDDAFDPARDFARINEDTDEIGFVRAAPRRRHHGTIEPSPR